ncbi:MAG: prolyl-tRNA synthetase associated domain-containing protein [Rhodospirillales bacterium]|jgi:Ala-tRNA(Pro) deacylase|nr:prolyl-tRNA synthetase associated domain-containing protein [Rhodospirillales bacterium]
MKNTRNDLLERLDALGLKTTTVDHVPVFTVEESQKHTGDLPGGHCKNLFLKDKKSALWLVVTLEDRPIDMKDLRGKIGSHHLSFGKPDLLMDVLGVMPGSVTPFALINDTETTVNVVLDADMMEFDILNYHPLSNDATTAIKPEDLLTFIRSCGHEPAIVTL